MKKIERKNQKENVLKDNVPSTNYYGLLKSFVYGVEKNPIKIPAHVKEQMIIEFLAELVGLIDQQSVEDASSLEM